MDRVNRISAVFQEDDSLDIVVPAGMVKEFQSVIFKGTNTNPNMHVEIRDFRDRLFKQDHLVGDNMKPGIQHVVAKAPKECPTCGVPVGSFNRTCSNLQYHKVDKQEVCYGHPETCNCPVHNR